MRNIIITNPAHIHYLSSGHIVAKRGAWWLMNVGGALTIIDSYDFDWI